MKVWHLGHSCLLQRLCKQLQPTCWCAASESQLDAQVPNGHRADHGAELGRCWGRHLQVVAEMNLRCCTVAYPAQERFWLDVDDTANPSTCNCQPKTTGCTHRNLFLLHALGSGTLNAAQQVLGAKRGYTDVDVR